MPAPVFNQKFQHPGFQSIVEKTPIHLLHFKRLIRPAHCPLLGAAVQLRTVRNLEHGALCLSRENSRYSDALSLTAFLVELIVRPQATSTVPMFDIKAYAKSLATESRGIVRFTVGQPAQDQHHQRRNFQKPTSQYQSCQLPRSPVVLGSGEKTSLPKPRRCRHVIPCLFRSGNTRLGINPCHPDDNS